MLEIFKIIGIGFVTAITAVLLKQTKPELSFAVTVTGILVILMCLIETLKTTLDIFMDHYREHFVDKTVTKLIYN